MLLFHYLDTLPKLYIKGFDRIILIDKEHPFMQSVYCYLQCTHVIAHNMLSVSVQQVLRLAFHMTWVTLGALTMNYCVQVTLGRNFFYPRSFAPAQMRANTPLDQGRAVSDQFSLLGEPSINPGAKPLRANFPQGESSGGRIIWRANTLAVIRICQTRL